MRGSGYDSLKHAAGSFEGLFTKKIDFTRKRDFAYTKTKVQISNCTADHHL